VSHIRLGRVFFHCLNEIGTHRPGQRVLKTYRCKPFGREASFAKRCCSQSRSAGFADRKGAMYPLFVGRFDPVDALRESDNDPNSAVRDCRVSAGPFGLHKPI
jgi:hypothetical protein